MSNILNLFNFIIIIIKKYYFIIKKKVKKSKHQFARNAVSNVKHIY